MRTQLIFPFRTTLNHIANSNKINFTLTLAENVPAMVPKCHTKKGNAAHKERNTSNDAVFSHSLTGN